jgi:hypothetical protein
MTPERAAKIAAKRIGCSVEEYTSRRAGGEKWCSGCRGWHDVSAFSVDKSRSDGLNRQCRESQSRYITAYLRQYCCSACGVASTGQMCEACYRARAASRNLKRERLAPYKRIAWAMVVAARCHRRWLKAFVRTAKRVFVGIGRLAARLIRERDVAARRERKRAAKSARWWNDKSAIWLTPLSFDAPTHHADNEGLGLYDYAALMVVGPDPLEEVQRETLWNIVGDLDIDRLGEHELARLRERLLASGYAPPSVQTAERERLRDANRHSGASVPGGRRKGGGRRTRKQQQQVTRDHHVRDLPNWKKREHAQFRQGRQRDWREVEA